MSAQPWLTLFAMGGVLLAAAVRLDDDNEVSQALSHSVSQSAGPSLNHSVSPSDSQWVFRSAGYSRNCEPDPVSNSDTLTEVTESQLTDFTPESEGERKWTELPEIRVAKSSARKPKLALLMFVKEDGEIANVRMWEAWMNQANEQGLDFGMYIHAKDIFQAVFLKYYVSEWVPTRRCDMFDAEIMLMRAAMQDPDVTHLMTVSANSVPTKSLSFIYKEIERQPATRMCMDFKFLRFGGTRKHSPRAESWWLMSRSDAMLFVDNEDLVRDTFKYDHKRECSDENTWALALLLRKRRWKEEVLLVDECPMFSDWIGSCKTWAQRSNDGCKNCEILRKEPHSEAGPGHPRSYTHVGVEAWQELLDTPFWFGRKFSDDAFAEIVDPWPVGEVSPST